MTRPIPTTAAPVLFAIRLPRADGPRAMTANLDRLIEAVEAVTVSARGPNPARALLLAVLRAKLMEMENE